MYSYIDKFEYQSIRLNGVQGYQIIKKNIFLCDSSINAQFTARSRS